MRGIIKILFGLLTLLAAAACSSTKYVPEGSYLLDDVRVKVAGGHLKGALGAGQLKSYVRQRGNSEWFSAFKLPLSTYSLSGRDTTKWVNRMLKSMGEAPVIYDSVQAQRTVSDLQQLLQNEGYLDARVELWVRKHGKKAETIYKLFPGRAYYLSSVRYDIADPLIAQLLDDDIKAGRGLHAGQQFSVSALDEERKRIATFLTENGYYRFHKEFIRFEADSVGGDGIGIVMRLSPDKTADERDTLHTRYRVGTIDYRPGGNSVSGARDSLIHLRSKVLHECTHITPGGYYSATDLQDTYNHFGRLGAVRYTNITFTERPDTAVIDCHVQLQTNKPSTLSFQPEGTNTAGDLGAAMSLTYQNRNLFRGAENLAIEIRGAYEAIRGLEGYRNQDFIEYSAEARLQFPRFLVPFNIAGGQRNTNAVSQVSLLYDLQNRPEFHRRVVSGGLSYNWSGQQRRDHCQLDLLDLNYVFMPWISDTFKKRYLDDVSSRNAILRYNYEDLFIARTGFGYSYNNGVTAFKANLETAGNVLNVGSRLFGAEKDQRGQYRLFNIAFAQYIKGDFNITRSIRFDYNNLVVLHFGLGVAWPYGNSTVLPFEKRYFSGGANSVRGWSVRSLGPGTFAGNDGAIDFINQTGDMKLDLNAEYRAHLFWKIGGALFVDAGNIWTLREYKDQPGGQFRLTEFYKQIAVGTGLGLRFNFDYFIVRFDLGVKVVDPAYEAANSKQFPLLSPRFSRDCTFHFAVGLPF